MDNLQLFETGDGSPSIFSNKFGVSYHSKYGAIQETQHVFIDAGLRPKALTLHHIDILDMGFGTGLNAFMTLLEADRRNLSIHYVGVEAYPLSMEIVADLNYAELLKAPQFAATFVNLHDCESDVSNKLNPNFSYIRKQTHFEELDYDQAFDLVYFDAFCPTSQPELWEEDLLGSMYRALRPGGILVTYCAKGVVKRTLKSLGFTIEAIKGPPGKREMTRAIRGVN